MVGTGRAVWQEWVCESKVNRTPGVHSSGCRVLTLQGYDIEEILYLMSLRVIGGGYFQLGISAFFRIMDHAQRIRVAPRVQSSLA